MLEFCNEINLSYASLASSLTLMSFSLVNLCPNGGRYHSFLPVFYHPLFFMSLKSKFKQLQKKALTDSRARRVDSMIRGITV